MSQIADEIVREYKMKEYYKKVKEDKKFVLCLHYLFQP